MQLRAVILLLLALALGAATVYLTNQYLKQETANVKHEPISNTTSVVVARVTLQPGTRLTPELLQLADYPEKSVPEGSFKSLSTLLGADPDKSPIMIKEVHKGEPLMKYKLSPFGSRGGLPMRIPEDMRAVTISTSEVKGVGGFALPGSYVDVLHTTDSGRKDQKLVTRIILQNTKVLAVDQNSSESSTDAQVVNAVTLLTSPFDAQRLTLAQKLGELNLVLRNEFDASIIEESVAQYTDLLTIEKDRPTIIYKRARRPRIEIIRGLEIEKTSVNESVEGTKAEPAVAPR